METVIVENEVRPEIEALLNQVRTLIETGKDFLLSEGKVIDSGNYLTIKRYCQKHGLSDEAVVTNWIRRGVIPAEDVEVIEELNNLRMIRDRVYK